MSKEKQTPAEEVKQIVLTKEQYAILFKIQSLLDSASDTLNDIDGNDTLFEIGKQVGDASSDLINAFNELGDLIDETNPNDESDNEWKFDLDEN
jgi:hypothetical protein